MTADPLAPPTPAGGRLTVIALLRSDPLATTWAATVSEPLVAMIVSLPLMAVATAFWAARTDRANGACVAAPTGTGGLPGAEEVDDEPRVRTVLPPVPKVVSRSPAAV